MKGRRGVKSLYVLPPERGMLIGGYYAMFNRNGNELTARCWVTQVAAGIGWNKQDHVTSLGNPASSLSAGNTPWGENGRMRSGPALSFIRPLLIDSGNLMCGISYQARLRLRLLALTNGKHALDLQS
jgi:hypothetical protein